MSSNEESNITSPISTNDITSNLLLNDKDVTCPICKEVFVFPRTYECGHTICELCMYEMDRRDISSETHTARIHHCPICRHPTLKSWRNRPISILLERISSVHSGYLERKREVLEKRLNRGSSLIYIPKNIDLASISQNARIKLALDIYEIILERLYIAAQEGLNHLIIKEKSIVSKIERIADILSVQLFSKHNIFKLLVTRQECTIYITKDAFTWRRQYENRRWVEPGNVDADTSEEETLEPAPRLPVLSAPPPPPPPSTPPREDFHDVLSTLLRPRRRLNRQTNRPANGSSV